MKAVCRGHVEIIQALVENRANVNVKNNGGITALYIAELKAQPETLRLLKDAGAIKQLSDKFLLFGIDTMEKPQNVPILLLTKPILFC